MANAMHNKPAMKIQRKEIIFLLVSQMSAVFIAGLIYLLDKVDRALMRLHDPAFTLLIGSFSWSIGIDSILYIRPSIPSSGPFHIPVIGGS